MDPTVDNTSSRIQDTRNSGSFELLVMRLCEDGFESKISIIEISSMSNAAQGKHDQQNDTSQEKDRDQEYNSIEGISATQIFQAIASRGQTSGGLA